jgi:hypothetical protein
MTQNQISINVKIAAVDVYVRIILSNPKEVYINIIKTLEIVVLSPRAVIILSTYQHVITVYKIKIYFLVLWVLNPLTPNDL